MFADYTARLNTDPDPGPDFLVTVHPSADPTAWLFEIRAQAVELYEALPATFTFEELVTAGETLGHSAERCVEYLREWEHYEMVESVPNGFRKRPESRPYF